MGDAVSNMYKDAKTWSPFKGCRFDCAYCKPSFQTQAKRQKRNCLQCYRYVPHYHEERLERIPSAEIVFVCGNADISFCKASFTRRIIDAIRRHNARCPYKTYYLQSKKPEYLAQFLSEFPKNVILVTTLETNRDEGYRAISKAPAPTVRYKQFKALDYPRKVLTIEPVVDFDLKPFARWIMELYPEYVWIGYNSRPKAVTFPEPRPEKLQQLIDMLVEAGIEVRGKTLRGLRVPANGAK
ncbi:MAG: DUF5131 family protein [Pirellulales bacterium]